MNKLEFINKNFKNVNLVIGNGFDLYNGLKTQYKDFVEQNKEVYENIVKLFSSNTLLMNIGNINDTAKSLIMNDLNLFDFIWTFKILEKKDNGIDSFNSIEWNDIESYLLDLVTNNDKEKNSNKEYNIITFDDIFKIYKSNDSLDGVKDIYNSYLANLIKEYIKNYPDSNLDDDFNSDIKLMKKGNVTKEAFMNFLLSDLKMFEKRFGEYIKNESLKYNNINIQDRISKIVDVNNITQIDSFNYDFFHNQELDSKINHINGDLTCPIFGTMQAVKPNDSKYIFSKTYRRLENLCGSEISCVKNKYQDVIVFGHSLNEQDYSYFFTLFNELKFDNLNETNKIAFAYTIYRKEIKSSIERNLRRNIAKLFEAYAQYIGRTSKTDGTSLFDELVLKNRVFLYCID